MMPTGAVDIPPTAALTGFASSLDSAGFGTIFEITGAAGPINVVFSNSLEGSEVMSTLGSGRFASSHLNFEVDLEKQANTLYDLEA
jgi:hypothetical protein